MLKQLNEAKKYRGLIEDLARRHDFLPSVICGMGSRESHWGLALTPPGPGGRGDFAQRRPRGNRRTPEPPDGGGYGRGLLQIDYDWHEFARDQMLRAMIAAYNGGATATLNAIQAGQDIDANTTGKDYSKDVLNRSGWFQLHGWR